MATGCMDSQAKLIKRSFKLLKLSGANKAGTKFDYASVNFRP